MLLKAVGHALERGRRWLANWGTICSIMTHELDHKDPTHLSWTDKEHAFAACEMDYYEMLLKMIPECIPLERAAIYFSR